MVSLTPARTRLLRALRDHHPSFGSGFTAVKSRSCSGRPRRHGARTLDATTVAPERWAGTMPMAGACAAYRAAGDGHVEVFAIGHSTRFRITRAGLEALEIAEQGGQAS